MIKKLKNKLIRKLGGADTVGEGFAVVHVDRGWTRMCHTRKTAERIRKAMAGRADEYHIEKVRLVRVEE